MAALTTEDLLAEYKHLTAGLRMRCEQVTMATSVLLFLKKNMWLPTTNLGTETAKVDTVSIVRGVCDWLHALNMLVSMDPSISNAFYPRQSYGDTDQEYREEVNKTDIMSVCKVLEKFSCAKLEMFLRILDENGASRETYERILILGADGTRHAKQQFLESLPAHKRDDETE